MDITKEDLDVLSDAIKRLKNDPEAQERIRVRMQELNTELKRLEKEREIDPIVLQQPMTI